MKSLVCFPSHARSQSTINIGEGPTTYYNWILSASTISTSVSLPLAGGLSDIFGRRWFLIIGSCFSLLGAIVGLAAQNVPTVISASIIAGFGAGSQQLA